MRPYWAVIKDSFREAIASRVLWVLLGLILLSLMALAPLGIRLNLTTEFAWYDIADTSELVAKLRSAALAPEPSPGRKIWSLIDPADREKLSRLENAGEGKRRVAPQDRDALRKALSKLIHRDDLYDAQAWSSVTPGKEARDLLRRPRGELSGDELARLNRLLIEAAYPAHFRSRPAQSISLTYLGMDLTGGLPFSREQVDRVIREWVLAATMKTVVGIFGIIAAILVTSTIMPQMFEPGSITLLLSKPISRSLLFVAKFVGGCAFILLNVACLVIGLWLILGTRFGIWHQGMLWCIPIFMFLFLIYYAVSALAGLIWKSAVISVVLTVVFWAACFSVGATKQVMEGLLLDPERIVKLADAGGEIIGVTESGKVQIWESEGNQWRQVYEPDGRGRGVPTIDGPIYHAETGQLLFGQGFRNPFGFAGQRITLRMARADDGWVLRDGPALPTGTATFLVENNGSVLAVAPDNIYRLQGQPRPAGTPIKVLGITLPLGGGPEFRPVLKSGDYFFSDPLTAAADPVNPRIVVVSGNDVYLFAREADGMLVEAAKRTLEGSPREGSAVAIAGDVVLVAREDGRIWRLSSKDLSILRELALEKETQPRFVAAAPDGSRFGVLFQNRRLWLIDGSQQKAAPAPVSGQGHISGFAFAGDTLLVADRVKRVTSYNVATLAGRESFAPSLSRAEWIYYYAVLPIYTLFPKPGELDNTVQYVLSGKQTTDMGMFRGDVAQKRENLHPWRPVRSGLAFVGVMLLAACLYIERHEF